MDEENPGNTSYSRATRDVDPFFTRQTMVGYYYYNNYHTRQASIVSDVRILACYCKCNNYEACCLQSGTMMLLLDTTTVRIMDTILTQILAYSTLMN